MTTATIKPNQDFKHGPQTFTKGRKYEVPLDDAKYFMSTGWAAIDDPEKDTNSLEIQDGRIGHKTEVK